MSYDLARMVRSTGKRRRSSIVIPAIRPTAMLANSYARVLGEIPRAWRDQLAERVMPAYDRSIAEKRRTRDAMTRDDANDLGDELKGAADQVDRLTLTLTPKMRNFALTLDKWHASTWIAKLKAATGVDATAIVGATGAAETLNTFYNRNLGLISSIDDETQRRVGNIVWAGYEAITPREEIAAQLAEAVGLGAARAKRIAVDQTTKLSGALDQQRQRDAGIRNYLWRHSHKRFPRPEHVARNGRVFSWDKPPADGPPGTLPFCGCHAEAILDLTPPASQESGAAAA